MLTFQSRLGSGKPDGAAEHAKPSAGVRPDRTFGFAGSSFTTGGRGSDQEENVVDRQRTMPERAGPLPVNERVDRPLTGSWPS